MFVAGRGESHVEEISQPIYSRWTAETPPIETTILAMPGQVELHLSLRCEDAEAGARRLREAREELAAALGRDVFSTDGRASSCASTAGRSPSPSRALAACCCPG